jgi:hypothetical protein
MSAYSLERLARGGLMLGYAALAEDEIRHGVRRLAQALGSSPKAH